MKKDFLGFDQQIAIDFNLDVVDVVLLDVIRLKAESNATKKKEIDGKRYVWICYKSIIEWLPILGLKKRALALRLDKLTEKGFLLKHVANNNQTYFSLQSELQRGCKNDDIPLSTELQPKRNRDIDTEIREKEKDNNKLLSKKKDDKPNFDTAFAEFSSRSLANDDFKYSLRSYRIKDYTALMEVFKAHVANQCKQSEFIDNGDVRNRTWLLHSMPYLDLSDAAGFTLGYGEYIKNNKRWYINRSGREIEVPLDAPPRRQGTIWYKEEGRWGPDI